MLAKVARINISDDNSPIRVTGSIHTDRGVQHIFTLDRSFIPESLKAFYTPTTPELVEGMEFEEPTVSGRVDIKGLSYSPEGVLPLVVLVLVPSVAKRASSWFTLNYKNCSYQQNPDRKLPFGSFCPECGIKLAGELHPQTPMRMVPEPIYPSNKSGVVILEQGHRDIGKGKVIEYRLLYLPVKTGVRVEMMSLTGDPDQSDQRVYFAREIKWDGTQLAVRSDDHGSADLVRVSI